MLTRVAIGLVAAAAWIAWCGSGPPAFAAEEHPAGAPADEHAGGHAAAGGGDIGIPPLDSWRGDLAIWTAVVFLVILALLWKFAWGPIVQALDKREQGIAAQISQAEEANRKSQELLGEYRDQLGGAKDEVRGIVEQGRRDAERVGREMIEKAKDEAAAEQDRALRQIDAAAASAMKELAEKGADLAVELAGKIVSAELKPGDHAALIERAVADFAQSPPGNN